MPFDFGSLEPRIYQILSAPGTDLSTISAKRVRRQLVELEPSLTTDFMRKNREDVDVIIASVFEQVSGVQGTGDNSPTAYAAEETSRKRKDQESDFPDEGAEETAEDSPQPKKLKKVVKNGRELSDAELARKLSSEINGRSTRTGGKGRGAAGKKSSRVKKSAATIDSDDDSDGIGGKRKKSSSGTAKGGFAKEFALR